MTDPAALDRTLHYTDDITGGDIEAIDAFLAPRLAEQRDDHYGTPGYKMAFALDSLVQDAANTARWHLDKLAKDIFLDSRDRLSSRQDLQRAWNRLWSAVYPWNADTGYDTTRWNHLDYLDPQDRARQEAIAAQAEAEMGAGATTARKGGPR
ncbi:hypothetical protein [Streptomyces sp. RKAG337]|uniref:hypothetical protein n=1 Tax=Streptomyces sp. RKAG337 TaxID=2893404 RepID=UPI0020333775|nr:hypothetical protein [Streptomyces sp. RKAG337]MCM2428690.1 hypothetical protein [Streptomyces sp. RKAG337]